uniref:Transmembrane protein 54 n=1 Tax=Xenopus tropicalis TaxID=8364 RepID=A0A803J439_XENTR
MDPARFGKFLMKLGLILIVIGHLNFIIGAIVHGLVLRHLAQLQDAVAMQYSVANITAVVSTILRWTVLVLGIINAILSVACVVDLVVSVIITVGNKGRTLLSSCAFTNVEFIQISYDCPFDPTRIYSTTLCLWVISILLDGAEVVFSVRCFLAVSKLMDIRFCHKRQDKFRIHQKDDVSTEQDALNEEAECIVML